jgi:hypothetical protein
MVFLLLFLCSSCAWRKNDDKPQETKEEEQLRLIARVQSRPGQKDFVLLEAFGKWTLEVGSTLYVYGSDGRTATLVTSGEKLGQYVAADISAGQVELGDAVYERVKVRVPVSGAVAEKSPEKTPEKAPEKASDQTPDLAPSEELPMIEPVPLPEL